MPAKRTVVEVRCPNGLHRKSTVHAYGSFERQGRRYQRYRCTTRTAGSHTFSVSLDEPDVGRQTSNWDPPPRCLKHPQGRVVRNGYYGSEKRRRQRYRCTPSDGSPVHYFLPPLPRAYVGGHGFADPCELCEQPRSPHMGEPFGARRLTWTSREVAAGLMALSAADTYGWVGRRAWRTSKLKPRARRTIVPLEAEVETDPAKKVKGKHKQTRISNARWHIAADWVEGFAPVIWRELEGRMRRAAIVERKRLDALRASGQELRHPMIWVADEQPISGKTDELYCVLVVGEYEWGDEPEPTLKLRVARVMPDRTIASWLLVFDELAGAKGSSDEVWPDFMISDNSSALTIALKQRLPRSLWVPSLWHVAYAIRRAVSGKKVFKRTKFQPIENHLNQLARGSAVFANVAAWGRWWDELEALIADAGIEADIGNRRAQYESAYASVLPSLSRDWIPISNAGIEELIKSRIRPIFVRRSGFTSIERTNNLLDLVVARDRFALDQEGEVARLLRADAHNNDGWSFPTRAISDPIGPDRSFATRYRSLRDKSLPGRAAFERGLF